MCKAWILVHVTFLWIESWALNVITATHENYSQIIRDNRVVLVKYYAPVSCIRMSLYARYAISILIELVGCFHHHCKEVNDCTRAYTCSLFHARTCCMQWCGHCKKLAPAFEQAATELQSQSAGLVTLAKLDFTLKSKSPTFSLNIIHCTSTKHIIAYFAANQEQVKKVTPSVIIRSFPTLLVILWNVHDSFARSIRNILNPCYGEFC